MIASFHPFLSWPPGVGSICLRKTTTQQRTWGQWWRGQALGEFRVLVLASGACLSPQGMWPLASQGAPPLSRLMKPLHPELLLHESFIQISAKCLLWCARVYSWGMCKSSCMQLITAFNVQGLAFIQNTVLPIHGRSGVFVQWKTSFPSSSMDWFKKSGVLNLEETNL